MRGYPRKTPELVAEMWRLRDRGWLWREIADHFGMPMRTVYDWGWDTDRSKRRALLKAYAGKCVDCGGPTDGSDGPGKARQRCADCTRSHSKLLSAVEDQSFDCEKHWSDDEIAGWLSHVAFSDGNHGIVTADLYREVYLPWEMPSPSTILSRFGSWRKAVAYAGLESAIRSGGMKRRFTEGDLIEALVAASNGRSPSLTEYEAWSASRPEFPSASLIRKRLGGWVRARRLAEARLS